MAEPPRLELGARLLADGARFRAFVTTARTCAVRLLDADRRVVAEHPMRPVPGLVDGVVEVHVPGVLAGQLYDLRLDDRAYPDPYARFLPHGVHGPARVEIEETRHAWRYPPSGRALRDLVIYELHVGTFTPEGTYRAASAKLGYLADLGVTAVELMPLSAAAGERGWGYDGVAPFAPLAAYGSREDLAAFVDEAHARGLSVLLDVVYNHLGPSGNYLAAFSDAYFARGRKNAWGDALDYAHPVVRSLVLESARMWLEALRFDGLRLDATHAIVDPSPEHLLAELASAAKALAPPRLVVAEDDRNEPALVLRDGLDGIWADDFHHQVHVTLTGEREGYYAAYTPGADGLARVIERGWLYEGQPYGPGGVPRGAPADALPAEAFVTCLQNHDQIGNRAFGERLTAVARVSRRAFLAATVLLLALPTTPLLFMGQEWAATTPFLYFTDHEPDLGRLVSEGRREEFAGFSAFSDEAVRASIPDPQSHGTFLRSRLDWGEASRPEHAEALALTRAVLHLRRDDPVLRERARSGLRASALGDVLVVALHGAGDVRWVVVNFGHSEVELAALGLPATSVLLASAPPRDGAGGPRLSPESAVVLAPARA